MVIGEPATRLARCRAQRFQRRLRPRAGRDHAGGITTAMFISETERLVIRNFQSGDWQALHKMIHQYESSGLAIYDRQWPASPEEIQRIVEWFASKDGYLAVCLKDTGRFIGLVSLVREKDDSRDYDLGYLFDFNYHGKGYATEACRAVVDHAFCRLQAERVVTGTAAVNQASCRLLARLGFLKTSETRCSFRNTPDGNPIEFLGYHYALSRDGWETVSRLEALPRFERECDP